MAGAKKRSSRLRNGVHGGNGTGGDESHAASMRTHSSGGATHPRHRLDDYDRVGRHVVYVIWVSKLTQAFTAIHARTGNFVGHQSHTPRLNFAATYRSEADNRLAQLPCLLWVKSRQVSGLRPKETG